MRKTISRAILVAGLMFGITSLASAQGLPGSGWWTSSTFQNVGTAGTGTVTLEVFPLQGSTVPTNPTVTFDLTQGSNKVFLPGQSGANGTVDVTPPLGNNFQGSLVASSNVPIVAIGQIGNNQVGTLGTPNGYASGQFRGSGTSASTLSYPLVKNNFGNKATLFSVQASGTDVTISATIKANNGSTHTFSSPISANKAVLLIPSTFTPPMASSSCGSDPNTSPCIGSLSVTATGGNIVGAAVEYQTNVTPATTAQSTSLFTPTDAGSTLYCPVVKNKFDATAQRYGGIQVQNVGNAPVTVNLELTISNGTGVGTKITDSIANIPAGASRTFLAALSGAGGLDTMPENASGSVKLTTTPADGSIIAIVNESNILAAATNQKSTTYSCFNPTTATGIVALPLIKEAFSNATTGVSIQNVGTGSTTVSLKYVCQGKPDVTFSSSTLASGASQVFFLTSQVLDNSLCAVTATAANPSTDKIVGIAQETSDPYRGRLDTKNYEGFNLSQ